MVRYDSNRRHKIAIPKETVGKLSLKETREKEKDVDDRGNKRNNLNKTKKRREKATRERERRRKGKEKKGKERKGKERK